MELVLVKHPQLFVKQATEFEFKILSDEKH